MQQQAVVARQFGQTASAYLTSTVHAQGADLAKLRELAAGLGTPLVLDLGCGAGHASFAVAPVARSVTAFDLSSEMLAVVAGAAQARGLHNVVTEQGNVSRLPFADDAFCMVVTRFSAHHWLDVPAALREAKRVLKPDGLLVVIDITAPEAPLHDTTLQAVELLRDGSHVRDYRPSEWTAMLRAAGFQPRRGGDWTLHMVFDEWTARMRTPPERVAAIRSLFASAPEETLKHFDVQADGSFAIGSTLFTATHDADDIY
ncbi:Ubiquinone/menaquinone biosynthesis C-methylase UbiE [Duganella sp. CF517]|uniref:class I SAM-dependent methyltransferase n=1 Tax=Duganella sp. CF517 TaxID=1881038 RepID=UPI0008AA8016|nr:class I SAM-dependent methyltransferase [Duganella sp. CF517]SEN60002.1 Ubiquinone/menaquinone biosynthesis C-methylase UbiE [Duganella sp. CF517]